VRTAATKTVKNSSFVSHLRSSAFICGSCVLRPFVATSLVVLAALSIALAEDVSTRQPAIAPEAVVARVAGEEIHASDVEALLRQATGSGRISPAALAVAQAQALDQLVNRRLVAAFLDREKVVATDAEVETALKAFTDRFGTAENADAVLARNGLTRAGLRDQVSWEVRWSKYVQKQLTDARLQAYFDAHHKDLDGTEVRVSHVLFRAGAERDLAAFESTLGQARALREQIVAQKMTFAEAAAQFSAGPSRHQGGDLGFIPRHGRMVEAFSAAAFALNKGEISPPVTTPFGVHLITVTDVRPGTKTWQEARPELAAAVIQQLFNEQADALRASMPVEFTGLIPYLDRRTGQVVMPSR
jgi:parvulin-like peptidyl-prolyl isomerase